MRATEHMSPTPLPAGFGTALALNFLWINASEVARYFLLVMPMMRSAFPGVPDVAPMDVPTFLIWGIWDGIIILAATSIAALIYLRMGTSLGAAMLAGTAAWLCIFVTLWLGLYNMNLATIAILAAALPLAWLEMMFAAFITRWAMLRRGAASG
jgi:hypothetical protein